MSTPNTPQHPNFEARYEHTDRETGDQFTVPFPAAVFGIRDEFFGVGKVVGSIDDNPMIEIQDRDSGEPVYVMGYESWWRTPVPDEVIENMTSGKLAIDSVAAYRQRQDDYWKTTFMADEDFLNDAGIDTESFDE